MKDQQCVARSGLDLFRINLSARALVDFFDDLQGRGQQTCQYVLALKRPRIAGEGNDLR